ncbi:MAG: hypothetical protein ACRD3L_01445 [Terriglobales bacterium]
MARRSHAMICGVGTYLTEGEAVGTLPDEDWLGVWIAARTRRPERLLRTIAQQFFPRFDFMGVHADADGIFWTHFRLC